MTYSKIETSRPLAGFVFISLLFATLIFLSENFQTKEEFPQIERLLDSAYLDIKEELDRAVFSDGIKNYYENDARSDALLKEFEKYKKVMLTDRRSKTDSDYKTLNFSLALSLFEKTLLFLLRFAVISFLLFYLAESFALLKFKSVKRNKSKITPEIRELINDFRKRKTSIKYFPLKNFLKLLFFGFIKIAGYLILFSPVYLAGYTFKFDYRNITFAVYALLVIFTNATLVLAVNKFYLLLEHEYQKGYVQTALIKGVNSDFSGKGAVSFARIFSPVKFFGEHVLSPVYKNAHRQFISVFKEIARFLITGMIIAELTLNLQDGIFYEMFRYMMRKEFDLFFYLLLLIFWTVKLTDAVTDFFIKRENSKYDN